MIEFELVFEVEILETNLKNILLPEILEKELKALFIGFEENENGSLDFEEM